MTTQKTSDLKQEKQEAMWSAILDFCSDHHTKPLKYLTENFTITRK